MFNFLDNNKTNKTFQKGSTALIVIGALLIITAAALGVFNGIVPKTTVEVETPKTRAEQKSPVKQTKTSFGAVQGLTKNLLNLNSEITSRSLAQEEKDLKIANLTSAVKQRKVLIKELMRENPRAFLVTAIKKNQRSLLPVNVQKDIEQETVITAKIEVLHIDDFKNPENSRFEYTLRTKDAKLNFYPTNDLYLISGAEVKISGFQLDDVVVSDINKQNFQVTKEAPPLESVGDQKTLVLLINFLDSPPVPFTKERAYDLVFNGQFQKFYKEQSYNQVSFSGDVIDWVTVQRKDNVKETCWATTLDELEKIIVDNNINLANYDHLVILPNNGYIGGCAGSKSDYIFNSVAYNLSIAWVSTASYTRNHLFQWSIFDFIMSHELGHSLGVMHANGWDCGDKTLHGEDCQHIEYGNYFDTMGDGQFSLHFNAFYKELLGWIKPDRSLFINQSGRYTINPLELDNGKNLAKIQIQNTTLTPFYLEYRKGVGFNSTLNESFYSSNQSGLFINNVIKKQDWFPFPRLLDMSPTSLSWWEDIQQVTLNGQNVFADPGSGITVGPIINTSTSSITFDVKLQEPTCISQKPSVIISNSNRGVNAGGNGVISVDFNNPDSLTCDKSDFNIVPVLPDSWQYKIYPQEGNIILAPEEFDQKLVAFTVPKDIAYGLYSVTFDVVNFRSGLKTSKETTVNIFPPLVVSNISPNKGTIGTEVVLSGSGLALYNSLAFNNSSGYVFVDNVILSDGETLKFQIPSELRKYDCGECSIQTPSGVYQITVFSTSAASNTVNFEVIESKPLPQLSITTPKDGDIITPKSKVVIIAEVSDEIKNKTERVEFYVNGARKCQDKTAPYSCNWQAPKKSGQTYGLQAKAYGNRKQSGVKPVAESEIIKVTAK